MPLVFTGRSGASEKFELLLEAYDGSKRIVVVSSQEAIDDHGLSAVQSLAAKKYLIGAAEIDGRITVLTTDFG